MKLIISEEQFKRFPLISEDIHTNPIIGVFEALFAKNKEKLNDLYLRLTSYTVHDVLFNISSINDIDGFASAYAKEVDDMARGIEHRVESMTPEEYDRNEALIEDIRNEVNDLNDIIYKKQSAIERLVEHLLKFEEDINELEGKYSIYTKRSFNDIKTIDV